MTVQVWADPIDQQQAVQNVKAFLSSQSKKGAKCIRAITQRNKEIVMEKAAEVTDAYFVFNIQGGGFVIAAADDRVPAVLGYADSGSFDMQEIPDNMRGWLEGMTAEIQAIQQEKGEGVDNAKATREAMLFPDDERQYRRMANREALEDLMNYGLDEAAAKQLVTDIVHGKVRHVRFVY